jgi:thioredoxin 1
MKIDFKRLNTILEAKAGRAIDRLDGLKCYTPEFTETLNSIRFMLESSKELEVYDTECQDCKHKKEKREEPKPASVPTGPQHLLGNTYEPLTLTNPNNTYLVMFYSDFCGPCNYLKPILQEYTETHNIDAEFISVDTQEGSIHANRFFIQGWPTVLVIEDNIIVNVFAGADPNAPEEMTKQRIDNELGKFFR